MRPKSVKSYLKMCVAIAEANRDELKTIGKLSEEEYIILGEMRADLQNALGECTELLKKHNLQYNS